MSIRSKPIAVTIIALASFAAGCGELFQKLEYHALTFTGRPGGPYTLSTGELPSPSQVQHSTIADVFVRLNDGAVFKLTEISEAEAKSHASAETDANGLTCYHLRDATVVLHYRNGKIVGAVLADRLPIARKAEGPFLTVPLSEAEVRQLFGDPQREAKFRGPMRWN